MRRPVNQKRARRKDQASSEEDVSRALPSGSHDDEVPPIKELRKEFDGTHVEAGEGLAEEA